MKRLLLDECVDWRLKRYFSPEYEVRAVHEMGWQGVRTASCCNLRRRRSMFSSLWINAYLSSTTYRDTLCRLS